MLRDRAAPRGPEAARRPALTADLKFRLAIRLITAKRGLKGVIARQFAAETGAGVRSIWRWASFVKLFNYAGVVRRRRSEAGRPKIYNASQWRALEEAAWRASRGRMRAEFQSLGLPGSYETFRAWIWRVRRGEAPVEARSA